MKRDVGLSESLNITFLLILKQFPLPVERRTGQSSLSEFPWEANIAFFCQVWPLQHLQNYFQTFNSFPNSETYT